MFEQFLGQIIRVSAVDKIHNGPSSGLPAETREFMESRLDHNFEDVRIHSGGVFSGLARRLGAEAYTTGCNIIFRDRSWDPGSHKYNWLLAHELAHFIQQRNGRFVHKWDRVDFDALEKTADIVADLVMAGRTIPHDFDFGAAPYGSTLCHLDQECPGTPYSAGAREIWMAANEAIELAYKNDPRNANHFIFFGSDFDDSLLKIGPETPRPIPNRRPFRPGTAEIGVGKGGKREWNDLISELRGLERQRRPDIIDFTERCFYEIKSTGYADRGTVQLESYYKIAHALQIKYGFEPWNPQTMPAWYPKHRLAMLYPDPTVELFVCTQATDHDEYPGMIIYDVRRTRGRRRQRRPNEIRMWDFWTEYDTFRPSARSQLRNAIPFYDPDSPDYVIIVPHEFFQLPAIRQLTREIMEPKWEKLRVQPEIARRKLILDPRVTQFWLGVVCIVGAAAIIVVSAGAFSAVGAGAGAVVAVETTSVAASTSAGIQSTIIVSEAMASQVAGTTVAASALETFSLSAYNAMISSTAVKGIATAGVLLILGTASTASAATKVSKIDDVIAIRVLPINDFTERNGQMYADSGPIIPDNMYTTKDFKDKFAIGRKIFYDNKLHWIFGQVSVR